jgi:prepilin-type N-terminal cleavage/methylation domain-containing protein
VEKILMNIHQKEKGFTIIEVVLVLAIAGLIFMMVFMALPALQRSQRDTQRKNDISRAITAVSNYTSNNRGTLPANTNAAWATFLGQYLTTTNNDTFIDPLGAPTGSGATTYTFLSNVNLASPAIGANNNFNATTQNNIYFSWGYTCTTGGAITNVNVGDRKVALRIYLEGGGVYCANN